MALFGGYFDSSSYSGGSTGLFDRLLQQVEAGNFLQAQTPDRTVAVGDYQMPQFGSAPSIPQAPGNAMPTDMSAQSRQPMAQPAPTMAAPEPAFGDRLMAGLEGFANAGGVIPAIAGGINGLVTGERSNPRYLKQQQMEGAYNAMIAAGVPGQAARGAVMSGNTELMKFVLDKYSRQKFGFSTLPDGTVVRQDQNTGDVSEAYKGGAKPQWGVIGKDADGTEKYGFINTGSGKVMPYEMPGATSAPATVTGPDGKEIPIPPGVDRKTFVKKMTEINADVAGGKMTEVQAKSAKFGNQMELAEKNVRTLEGEGNSRLSRMTEGSQWLPGSASIGRSLQTDEYQKYIQARDSFITALLRDESGAAIGSDEFNRREKEMFPQPGDGDAVIAQKRELRRVAIEGMKQSAGPGYKPIASSGAPSGTKTSTGISWSIEK